MILLDDGEPMMKCLSVTWFFMNTLAVAEGGAKGLYILSAQVG